MPGLVPGIHALRTVVQDVDGRDKPGHDGKAIEAFQTLRNSPELPRPAKLA